METIINQVCENLKANFVVFFAENHTIDDAERHFGKVISEATAKLVSAYLEEADQKILNDKAGRKAAGMVIERKNENRTQLTSLGEISYERTYYSLKDGTYCYPVDEIAGVEPYQRISNSMADDLANAAIDMSYAKAGEYTVGEMVSKQTVMSCIRRSEPCEKTIVARRKVPVLHIDVDEDHVAMQHGKGVIVPSFTVYEGIDVKGKRHSCINAFGISEFGMDCDTLWEKVVNEVDRRYDIEDTVIYIHGDGAEWIKNGKSWFANSIYVLDPYHRNKYIKLALSGISKEEADDYKAKITATFKENNIHELTCIQGELISKYPDRYETIYNGINYLLNNFESIVRYYTDDKARCGATEPHVSHMLSSRLSSRPMGWSKKTLEKFAPILAAGKCHYAGKQVDTSKTETSSKIDVSEYLKDNHIKMRVKKYLGSPDPDHCVTPVVEIDGKPRIIQFNYFKNI